MKARILKYKLEISGALVGAIAGWCYWYFVGCASGACLITSRPANSALYGALMGYLFVSMFRKPQPNTNYPTKQQ
jgi:hypothetical protein